MNLNSRDKGKRGERELAFYLTAQGFPARRGQQFSGGSDSPDVVCDRLPWHIECKRVEAGNPYLWLEQAERDASKTTRPPVVFHRRNDKPWVVVAYAGHFLTQAAENEHLRERVALLQGALDESRRVAEDLRRQREEMLRG